MSGNNDGTRDKIESTTNQSSYEVGKTEPSAAPVSNEQRVHQSGSTPIDIKQHSSGKFGVLHARQSSPTLTDAFGEPVPIDKIIKTANTMSSMMMAHKIALEDDFRLEPGMDISGPLMSLSPIIGSSPTSSSSKNTSEPGLHNRVKDIVHEAYWDLFREELKSQSIDNKQERKYDISKQLIADVLQRINELLLPQHARLKQDVEDRLDPKIIDQLASAGSLNLRDYAMYILGVLSKLCAPVRDEKLKELSSTEDVVQIYRGIMELLELMRLDFANFTLNRFKPHIRAHSHDYEREKFNEILKQQKTIGIDGLEFTKIWLERAVKRVDAAHGISEIIDDAASTLDNLGRDDETSNNSGGNSSKRDRILRSDIVDKILHSAYCELLEWTCQTQKLYPETLLFDEATFKQLEEQYKVLLLTSSILLTTFAFISKFKFQGIDEFKVTAKSHVITLLTASYDNLPVGPNSIESNKQTYQGERDDAVKLETIAVKLCDDIKHKLVDDKEQMNTFEGQEDLFRKQILDLQSSSNRVRELARRRILEFIETLLVLDVKHQRKNTPSKMPPPVNIPLGLNCLADEITLTMAQLVKIIRYNRRVFFQHYQDIIVDIVSKII